MKEGNEGRTMDIENLKRELSDALVALRQGKGILGRDGMADEVEAVDPHSYRFLAQAIRSGTDGELLKAIITVLAKLDRRS